MHNYKKLNVWVSSISLVKNIYKLTKKFPKDEMFVLTQQLRRVAISIPSNIAEGAGRNSNAQFKNFLQISIGSCYEAETQLIISKELEYISEEELDTISKELEYISEEELDTISKELDSIMKMNHNLQKTL